MMKKIEVLGLLLSATVCGTALCEESGNGCGRGFYLLLGGVSKATSIDVSVRNQYNTAEDISALGILVDDAWETLEDGVGDGYIDFASTESKELAGCVSSVSIARALSSSGETNKISAVVGLGYGFDYGNCRVALEGLIDLGKESRASAIWNYNEDHPVHASLSSSGITPSIAIILGGRVPSLKNALFYLKGGLSFTNSRGTCSESKKDYSVSKPGLLLGSGIEVPLGCFESIIRGVSLRVEGEYRFPVSKRGFMAPKKDLTYVTEDDADPNDYDTAVFSVTNSMHRRTKAWGVRVMFCFYPNVS
ncbi:MAG: hypothetical protein LBJ16_01120 [Holosporaceae bacterium]|nr:hypothetical protein [Holosporaceae bacterium]